MRSDSIVPGTNVTETELARLLVHELATVQCRCARPKQPRQTFCRACYYTLPPEMRQALYLRVGKGYEAAYVAAANILVYRGRIQGPSGYWRKAMPTSSPMPRQRSRSELERICKAWNDKHDVGKWVRVRRDDGSELITKTRSPAYVLSGHTPVIFVEQITGAYLLDRVTPIDTVKGAAGEN